MSTGPGKDGERRRKAPPDSVRGAVLAGAAIVAVFFGALGGWASVAPLNSAVVATAFVKVEGNRKSVEHLDGGSVREVRVREGDSVREGEVLVVLDDTELRAAVDVLDQQNALLLALQARLGAERDGADRVAFPSELAARADEPSIASVMTGQELEFQNRRAALAGQQQVLGQRVGQLQQTIAGTRAQLAAFTQQLASLAAERLSLGDLYAKGLIDRSRMLELERSETAFRGQMGQAEAEISRAEHAIAENADQIVQLTRDRASEVSNALRETQSRLLDVAPRLKSARTALDRTVVRAPYSGIVVGLTVFSVGGVIAPGHRILDIVPTGSPLVVEAQVPAAEIADVAAGAIAEVQFAAYKQRVIPIIHGRVTTISADRLTDERTGIAYYAAAIEVDAAELAASPEVRLYPGMPATVMIPTGARTALAYLVGPLTESFDRAFRQR